MEIEPVLEKGNIWVWREGIEKGTKKRRIKRGRDEVSQMREREEEQKR